MDYFETVPFSREVLLRSKRFGSGLWRPQGDSEEMERLINEESIIEQTLHLQPPPPQLKVRSSPTSNLDDVALSQRYAQMAQEFLLSLPSPHLLLSPEDVKITDEQPVAAGGSADILKGKHEGSEVVVKAYRYYRLCDITQIVAVRRDHPQRVHS